MTHPEHERCLGSREESPEKDDGTLSVETEITFGFLLLAAQKCRYKGQLCLPFVHSECGVIHNVTSLVVM